MADIVFTFDKNTGNMTFETTVTGSRCQKIHDSINRGMADMGFRAVDSHETPLLYEPDETVSESVNIQI